MQWPLPFSLCLNVSLSLSLSLTHTHTHTHTQTQTHTLSLSSDAVENPFCAVDMMERLRASPTTRVFMEDEAFVGKLEELREQPNKLMKCVACYICVHYSTCFVCMICMYESGGTEQQFVLHLSILGKRPA